MNIFKSLLNKLFFPLKSTDRVIKNYLSNTKSLTLTEDGFRIVSLDGSHDTVEVKWDDVGDVKQTNEGINFILKSNEKKTIYNDWMSWHLLLRNIPEGFKSFDYESVSRYFNSLQGCEVCGLNAVLEHKCQSCASHVWNEEISKEYTSKEEYIREEQLDLF